MADFLIQDCAAENVTVYDTNRKRRLRTGIEITKSLIEQGWTVFVFSGLNGDAFAPIVDCRRLRQYVPIDMKDVDELIDSATRERTAVVIDGLMTPAGAAMRRLLKQSSIFVVTLSSVRCVRGDHRYGRLWTPGKLWRLRQEPKEFTEVDTSLLAARVEQPGWLSWLW